MRIAVTEYRADVEQASYTLSVATAQLGHSVRVSAGMQGARGPQGIAPAPQAYPLAAVSTWTHTHDYGYRPAVRVVDAAEQAVLIAASYPAPDQVSLTFPAPFTGTVLLT